MVIDVCRMLGEISDTIRVLNRSLLSSPESAYLYQDERQMEEIRWEGKEENRNECKPQEETWKCEQSG